MLKKKVLIKSKVSEPLPTSTSGKKRGRPPKSGKDSGSGNNVAVDHVSSVPNSRVYNLSKKSELTTNYIVNNLVQLKLTTKDILRLEEKLRHVGLLKDINKPIIEPSAWNSDQMSSDAPSSSILSDISNPFKSLIKHNINIVGTIEKPNRKELIINSGVKRKAYPIMQLYNQGWPTRTSYVCWYCCHKFNTTPVGIPQLLIHTDFNCYGNFCSYNCAKRYLRPLIEDDMAMLQTPNDIFMEDDLGEKMQLLELLYHLETNAPLDEPIKPAPSRLTLTMFGGTKTIEEFRKNFSSHSSYHVFRSPLVPVSYQMEECTDKTEKRRRCQHVSLDTMKIQKAFNALSEKAAQGKVINRKPSDHNEI
jgi:hypothetical protein